MRLVVFKTNLLLGKLGRSYAIEKRKFRRNEENYGCKNR